MFPFLRRSPQNHAVKGHAYRNRGLTAESIICCVGILGMQVSPGTSVVYGKFWVTIVR